ncbi:MAG TPA: hypothetical protein VEV13_02750 [Candidatus Limnocylindria bacterium]|nr:hypothetical protein [Candidatus Limnocylindria bacterium]
MSVTSAYGQHPAGPSAASFAPAAPDGDADWSPVPPRSPVLAVALAGAATVSVVVLVNVVLVLLLGPAA